MSRSDERPPIVRYTRPAAGRSGGPWTHRLEAGVSSRLFGSKAAGLGELMSAGFDVPPGFCVTTEAFDELVSELARESDDLESLRRRLLEVDLPESLLTELRAQMEYVGADRWAVRSSAIAEDLSARSYAGQALTVLDVEGFDDVVEALRRVWASHLSMDRLLYHARGSVRLRVEPTAVLIQAMLDPVVAGVLFTMNPITGDASEVVVTSARGLGESVVAGRQGDTYYLDKRSGYVRRHVADKAEGLLAEDQQRQLATIARGVETAMGGARDVEWAYAFAPDQPHRPRLFLLQARPITAEGSEQVPDTVWTNANVGEALPGVATPLTWSIIADFSRRGFEQAFGTLGLTVPDDCELVRSVRGRIYLNLTQFMSIASGQPLFKPERLFSMAGGGGVDLVRDIYEKRSKRGFLKRLPFTIPRVMAAQLSMPLLAPLWGKIFTGKVEEYFDRDLRDLDFNGLAADLEHLDDLFDRTGLIMLATSSNFLMSYVVTAELLRFVGGEEAARHEQELFSDLDVKSAEPGLALLELGRMVRRSLRLRRIVTSQAPDKALEALQEAGEHEDVAQFLAALDEFRKNYGHRAPREAELATPRWREDMTFLFEVMQSFVEAPHLPSSLEVERDKKRNRKAAHQALNSLIPGGAIMVVKAVLAFTRSNARRREYMRDRVVDSLDVYRHFFLECGRRLSAEGHIKEADDVFFLTRREIEEWLEAPELAERFKLHVLTRRAVYDHFREQPDPPDTFLLRGAEMIAASDAPRHLHHEGGDGKEAYLEIPGLPGSPGRVTGRARVILDPNSSSATIQPGEILVAPYTDVGWTPLFLTAAGVVMNLGGPLSHSCIVAREYGIPTVVNAKHATDVLETGDMITVDGDRGVVYVRREEDAEKDENAD